MSTQNVDFSTVENITFNGSTVETMVVDGQTLWAKMASGDIYYVGQTITINGSQETVVSITGTSIQGNNTTVDTSNPGNDTITTTVTTNQTSYTVGQVIYVDGVAKTISGISGSIITFQDGSTVDANNLLGVVLSTTDPNAGSGSGGGSGGGSGSTSTGDNSAVGAQESGVGETVNIDGNTKTISTLVGTVYTFDDGTTFDTANPGSSVIFPFSTGVVLYQEGLITPSGYDWEPYEVTSVEYDSNHNNLILRSGGQQRHWISGGPLYPPSGWKTHSPMVFLPDWNWGFVSYSGFTPSDLNNAVVQKQTARYDNYSPPSGATGSPSYTRPWWSLTPRTTYSVVPVWGEFDSQPGGYTNTGDVAMIYDRGSVLDPNNRQAVGPLDGTFSPSSSALSHTNQGMTPTIEMLTDGTAIGNKHSGTGIYANNAELQDRYQQGLSLNRQYWTHGSASGNIGILPTAMMDPIWDGNQWIPGNNKAFYGPFADSLHDQPTTFPDHVTKFYFARAVGEYIFFYDQSISKYWGYAWFDYDSSARQWHIYGGVNMSKGQEPWSGSGAVSTPREDPETWANLAQDIYGATGFPTVTTFYPANPMGIGNSTGSGRWKVSVTL